MSHSIFKPMPWRSVRCDAAGNPVEWQAHAFSGAVAYGVRRMRDGRFAFTIGSLQHDAVDTFEQAAAACDEDRQDRIKHELL